MLKNYQIIVFENVYLVNNVNKDILTNSNSRDKN